MGNNLPNIKEHYLFRGHKTVTLTFFNSISTVRFIKSGYEGSDDISVYLYPRKTPDFGISVHKLTFKTSVCELYFLKSDYRIVLSKYPEQMQPNLFEFKYDLFINDY